jgi:apolipoprotein N-acyltransferase
MNYLAKAGLGQWALSGVLLGVGFIFPILWSLGILGIAYFLYLAQQEVSIKKVVVGGFVAWTIKSLAALLWFLWVYPIDWLTVFGDKPQLFVVAFYWFTFSLWLGVGGIFVATVAKKLFSLISENIVLALLIPVAWIFGEVVGSFFFSLMTLGEGGAITSALSFGYVGYLLAQHEWLIWISRIYGVYALSFAAVLLALGCLWSVKHLTLKKKYLAPVVFILFWVSGYLPFIPLSDKATEYHSVLTMDSAFTVAQSQTVEGEKEKSAQLEKMMQTALALKPDYLLLPEDTRYFSQSIPAGREKAGFQLRYGNPETIIVDSGRALEEGKTVLQAFTYNGLEDIVDVSQKRYLVPQGEFMPYLYVALLRITGYGSAVEIIGRDISYTVGSQTSQAEAAVSTPGILYCFESVSPWGVKKIMQERGEVPFIAHPISHGWFNEPRILWKNLDSMLRVQAIWNQQYIVSAGGHVVGQVFTPQGKILTPRDIASGDNWTLRQSFIPILP